MTYPAGIGPAGFAPIQAPGDAPPQPGRGAVKFDGATGDYLVDDDGRAMRVTSIQQGIALSYMIRKGTIASAPDVGHTFNEIAYQGQPSLEADLRDRALRAFPASRYFAAGDAELDRVDHEEGPNGLKIAIYWFDLRADAARKNRRKQDVTF